MSAPTRVHRCMHNRVSSIGKVRYWIHGYMDAWVQGAAVVTYMTLMIHATLG